MSVEDREERYRQRKSVQEEQELLVIEITK